MRKYIALVLALVCAFGLAGCSNTPATGEEKWDLIPMVMIDGVLYLDTGHNNTDIRKCGTPDGEITSEVDGSERPTVDNQSNFGTGYGYQYGATEGTIEIYMNEKWRIFATEEVRKQIQFPEQNSTPQPPAISPISQNTPVEKEPSSVPGALTIGVNGGAYWGYTGYDPNNTAPRLGDKIEIALGNLCREKGYDIHITLYRNLEDQRLGGEPLDPNISTNDLMEMTVAYFASRQVGEQVFILYIGERNECAFHVADPDFPEINLVSVEAAFCDETISDPIERVEKAVDVLAGLLK